MSSTHLNVLWHHFMGKGIITTHKCPRWMQDGSYHERVCLLFFVVRSRVLFYFCTYIHTYIHMTNRKWFLFLFLHFIIHCVYRVSYWNDHYWFPDIKAIASWRQIGKCLPFENISRLNLMQIFFSSYFHRKKTLNNL